MKAQLYVISAFLIGFTTLALIILGTTGPTAVEAQPISRDDQRFSLAIGSAGTTYFDDFSSYAPGLPPTDWLIRGSATTITPTIEEIGGTGPAYRLVSFPEVPWEYWDKSLLKNNLILSSFYTVTVKLNFQNSVADRAGLTIAWDDTNFNHIEIQPNVYWDNIEFHVFYNGPITSSVVLTDVDYIPIDAFTDYWLRAVATDYGPGQGKVIVYWSTDNITFQPVVTATGLAELTGLAGISTAGPHLPYTHFDDFSVSSSPDTAPPNDDFDNAFIIDSLPYSNSQDTSQATAAPDDPDSSCFGFGTTRSVWYRYTASDTGTVSFDTDGSDYDTWMAIYTGSRGNLTEVACNDDYPGLGLSSRIDLDVAAGTTYHLLFGIWSEPGQLTVNATPVQTQPVTCNTITEIPTTECQALEAFYNSTNGDAWGNWFDTNTPCSTPWTGIGGCTIPGNITQIDLINVGIIGTIPPELGNLAGLEVLDISQNQLSGNIPPQLGNLTALQWLDLSENQLSGSIPPELGNLSLSKLGLEFNQLSGNIPPELGNLSSLNFLYLNNNQLNGSIPPELGNFSYLLSLYLDNNQLSGNIPPELGNLSSLNFLYLNNNQLNGSIPLSFIQLQNLFVFWFNNTNLCEPGDAAFQNWLSTISNVNSTGVICTPSPPTLVSPSNGSTTSDNTPTFDWTASSGATEYQLQVDNNTDFSSPEINITTASTDYTPTSGLSDATYSWRVRAGDGAGNWSNWSSVWSVTIATGPTCHTLTRTHTGSGNDPVASPTNSAGCSLGQYMAGEAINVTASPASGWEVGSWNGTDNDSSTSTSNSLTMPAGNHTVTVNYIQQPTVQFSAASFSVNEGNGSATIEVTRSGSTADTVTVNYATSDGTATAGSDYIATSGTLTFAPGQTSQTFSVSILEDADDEPNEVVNLMLSAPSNATLGTPTSATLTIVDNDGQPSVQFSTTTFNVNESGGVATIEVTLSPASSLTVMVDYATSDGTATAGSDYTATSGTLTFVPGQTSQTFSVAILEDMLDEPNETVNLTLNNVVNAVFGTPSSATLTIVDNDVCYTLTTSVIPSDGGSISASPPPNCAGGKYSQNTNVQLTASPNTDYTFSHWSGDLSGSANPTTVTMTGNKNVIANFNQIPPPSTSAISGRVTDANSNPISDVTISDNAGHTTTTDSNGNYTFSSLTSGTYTITPTKSGYTFSPPSRTVSVPPDATGQDFTARPLPGETDPPPEPEPGKPWVQSVKPCFTGAYWPSGAFINNRFTAHLDWQGTIPDYVDFTLNNTTSQETPSPNTAAHTYNMGTDLQYGILGTRNALNVVAHPQSGPPSNPHTQTFIGYGLPLWLPQATLFRAIFYPDCPEQPLHFRSEWSWEFPIHGQVTPPRWLPFIGGQSFGLRKPEVRFETDVSTDGSGRVEGGGKGNLDVAGKTISGSLTIGGEGSVSESQGFQITAADFGGEIGGQVKKKWPMLDFICDAFASGACPLQEAENAPIIGPFVRQLNGRAKVEAQIEPAAHMKTRVHTTPDGWVWDWLDAGGRVKITIGLVTKIIESLSAYAYGGGEPDFSLKLLPDLGLDQMTARLFGGLELRIFSCKFTFPASYEWHYPETQTLTVGRLDQPWARTIPIPCKHIPRDYAVTPTIYAIFRANEQPLQLGVNLAALNSELGLPATEENIIATNVFPEGHPAIAADNSTLLLWVHDDTNKPLMQGEEIYYSVYNGTTWSTPAGITSDNLQDFAPHVAFDQNNNAVAVWERNKVIQSESSEFNSAYTNAFEIASAVWDGNTWSTPVLLTDNDVLDHAPMLTRGNDGTLLLIWRQNPAGELLGSAANPDTLFYAFWNGSAWSTPQVLLNTADGVLDLTAAHHDADTMAVVYSKDTDSDLATDEDQELYVLTWNGNVWSDPTALTNDGQADSRPTLFYDSAGHPRLLWLKDDTLYALMGSLMGTPQAIAVEAPAAVLDYGAAQDNDDNLVLLWQGYSAKGVDVFYAAYDQSHNVFSLVEQLTYDEPLEKFMAPAFSPTGEMVMGYNKTALVTETITVSPTLVISNVTTFGQTDLYVLRHTFGPDLRLTATDLAVNPANPPPGSTSNLSLTLHNIGDRAVVNPEVAFYLGDPSLGGSPIDTATAPLTLAGGMTTTLSVEWAVPASGGPFDIYAVADPNSTVNELDETNNTTHFLAVLPDLTPANVGVAYGSEQVITLTTTLSNTGVVATAPVTVAFRLNHPITGTLVAMGNTESLAAGAVTEIQAIWDVTSVPTGRHKIYAIADPNDEAVEADETNNDEWVGVGILPDLVLRSTGVVTGTNGDSLLVSVWVFNEGQRDANGVILGLYDRLPQVGATPLVSTMLDIPAGEHRVATLNLGNYPWPGFWVGVGINGEVEDRDISNNLLLVGQVINPIYLPLILKNYVLAPDLVIEDIIASDNNVQVIIKNQGGALVQPVDEFWVDVYINPNPVPTGVNQIWDNLASEGLVWGVTASALPLEPGETLTLTIDDAYYWPDFSTISWPLAAGTQIYAQVDSANANTTYGSVLENHEIVGGAYNNIKGPVSPTPGVSSQEPASVPPSTGEGSPGSDHKLPPRR